MVGATTMGHLKGNGWIAAAVLAAVAWSGLAGASAPVESGGYGSEPSGMGDDRRPSSTAVIDDFSDSDYTQNPAWTAVSGSWDASAQNLKTGQGGTHVISTAAQNKTGEWSFRFNFPSGGDGVSARVRFWFMATSADMSTANGYSVQVATGSSDNAIALIAKNGGSTSTWSGGCFNKGSGWNTIRVSRQSNGAMTVYLNGGSCLTGTNTWISSSSFIGLLNYQADNTHDTRVDDLTYASFDVPPAVTVTKPNGGETIYAGSTFNSSYSVSAGTHPLSANPMSYSYSVDGGTTWKSIASAQTNSGYYLWTVPNDVSTNARFRAQATDTQSNVGADSSDASFTIASAAPPGVTVTAPNGGESLTTGQTFEVKWNVVNGTFPLAQDPITVLLSTNGTGGPWSAQASSLPNSGSYLWPVPNAPSTQAAIRVEARDTQSNVGTDASDAVFQVIAGNAPPFVALQKPSAGEAIRGAYQAEFRASDGNGDTVSYEFSLSSDSGASWSVVGNASHQESGTVVTRTFGLDTTKYAEATKYRFKVAANDGNGGASESVTPGDFTIDNTAPACAMAPLPKYSRNPAVGLSWSGTDNGSGVASYEIRVSVDGAASQPWLTNSTNNSAGYTGLEGHKYAFTCVATDRAGNAEQKGSPDTETTIDSVAPTSNLDPLPPFSPSTTVEVIFHVTDISPTKTTVHWRKAGGQWAPAGPFSASPAKITVPAEGKYEFSSVAEDEAGNVEAKQPFAEATTMVDTSPPTGSVTLPSTLVNTRRPKAQVTAQDGAELARASIEYRASGSQDAWKAGFDYIAPPGVTQFDKEVEVVLPSDGTFDLRLVVRDRAGTEIIIDAGKVTADTVAPKLASPDPKVGLRDVPVPAVFELEFSEPMLRASTEKAFRMSEGAIQSVEWLSDSRVRLSVSGLEGNLTYHLAITAEARDPAGNALKETTLTVYTVPTTGSLVGIVKERGSGAVVRNAKIIAVDDRGKETKGERTGAFRLSNVSIGNRTVRVEASGYVTAEFTVTIIGGQDNRVVLELEKDPVPYAVGGGVGAVVASLLLFLLLRWRKRSAASRKQKVAARKAAGARPKSAKPQIAPAQWGPPPAAAPLATRSAPVKCSACGAQVPPEEDFCPKCGQGVGGGASAELCEECGGTLASGACPSCGAGAAGERAAEAPPKPLKPPVQTDGGDAVRGPVAGKQPAPAPRPTPGPLPSCPACESSVPAGTKFCDVCGEPVAG
jgi:hypothetical protein